MKGFVTREMFEGIPEIDFNTGSRYFLGNMDNYKQALMSILKSIKNKLPILEGMFITKEYEGLRTITQTLRRMLGNVGANDLSELSYRLEMTLLNQADFDLEEELVEFINCLIIFSDHLETLLKKLNVKNGGIQEDISICNYDFTKTRESIKLSTDLLGRKII